MKKIKNLIYMIAVIAAITAMVMPMYAVVVPNSESSTNMGNMGQTSTSQSQNSDPYRVGYMKSGSVNPAGYSNIMNAFTNAFGLFDDGYNPTSDVTSENGYYSQTYSNADGQNASIYVGKNNKAYSVGYPIYDSWDSVGGLKTTGYPTSDAYSVNGGYYQNFTNGYVKYADDDNVSFVESKSVDRNGVETSINDMTAKKTTDSTQTDSNRTSDTNGSTDSADKTDKNRTTNNNTLMKNQLMSGTGADASGVAGSLSSAPELNPFTAIAGLVILAAVIILLVALSYGARKSRDR